MASNDPSISRQEHWDDVYNRRAPTEVSWFESKPNWSLGAITSAGLDLPSPIIDVGGGASTLADELIRHGFCDVSVLDISEAVLANVRVRLAAAANSIHFIQTDITRFEPARAYALWHDRAVFHFLTTAQDRDAYRRALREGTSCGSHVLISTFGPQGPQRCSGLDTVRYDSAALARELGDDFQLIDASIDVHTTPGGNEQQFLHARFKRT
jgi:hypothetical protein